MADSHKSHESEESRSSQATHTSQETQPTYTRKTRFVCISDTHNATPHGSFKLPPGDVLIHAGDLTNQGSYSELEKTIKWIEEADFEAKIIVAGNHDITLDSNFYSQYGLYFHNQNPQDPAKCRELISRSSSILYLNHEAAEVSLSSPTGPHTTFRVFGSPYSPSKGMWAFGYNPSEALYKWDDIPLDVDIVVTHTPPKYHLDERNDRIAAGCEYLRQELWRVRPRLAICGHVHEGRGAETIRWDLGASNIKYKESSVTRWEDPGKDNKKISLVDLSSKGTNLQNDGSRPSGTKSITSSSSSIFTTSNELTLQPENTIPPRKSRRSTKPLAKIAISNISKSLIAVPEESLSPTRGQGGIPPSLRCDLEALSGRMGRQETCVVNAGIMASSWPHGKGHGGKKFNKPIVVDIELPVWE